MKKFLLCVFCVLIIHANYDRMILDCLYSYYEIPEQYKNILETLVIDSKVEKKILISQSSLPLFKYFPALRNNLPHVELCDLPSPIIKCSNLEKFFQLKNFSIKHDGKIGKVVDGHKSYSGNKFRKLEFLLADAISWGAKTVITFGQAGSNHALATTVGGKYLGLDSICMLKKQYNDHTVRRNLLLQRHYGAKLLHSLNHDMHLFLICSELIKNKITYGQFPYVIPVGGSCAIGCVGFVNAAFELHEQIKEQAVEAPDYIYLPLGSTGTAAGLILGLKLLKIKSKIMLVAIEPCDFEALEKKLLKLLRDTNELLHNLDNSFPILEITRNDYTILTDYCGQDYALYTQESVNAINLVNEQEAIKLDGVYTGKTFAGMLDHILINNLEEKNILFWNTFCGESFTNITAKIDYKNLPVAFHEYFERATQELDKLLIP